MKEMTRFLNKNQNGRRELVTPIPNGSPGRRFVWMPIGSVAGI